MWIVLGVLALVVVWAVMKSRKATPAIPLTADPAQLGKDVAVTVWQHDDTPAGKVVTLSKSVVLTLTGENAGTVVDYLARTANHLEDGGVEAARRRSFELAVLMARNNVECPEVEAWRTAMLKKVEAGVRGELGASGAAENASEEYRDEFVDLASEKLHELGVPGFYPISTDG